MAEQADWRMVWAAALQVFCGRRPTFRYCHEQQDWMFVR